MKKIIALAALVALVGCTDTDMASFGALGRPGHITCYSGTLQIYDGTSTGKIQTVSQSDGWEFEDAATKSTPQMTC